MSDVKQTGMFAGPAPEKGGMPVAVWGIAGVAVLLVVAVVLLMGRHKTGGPAGALLPLDPYAASLAISDIQMSESSSLSSVKLTYIDGHIKNNGSKTMTSATAQVLFKNDVQMPPQVETAPVMLIRTHEPYVDTQPISASPLKPGDDREFRLVFESINANWNQQLPEIHVTGVSAR
jgi:hypothetical protein